MFAVACIFIQYVGDAVSYMTLDFLLRARHTRDVLALARLNRECHNTAEVGLYAVVPLMLCFAVLCEPVGKMTILRVAVAGSLLLLGALRSRYHWDIAHREGLQARIALYMQYDTTEHRITAGILRCIERDPESAAYLFPDVSRIASSNVPFGACAAWGMEPEDAVKIVSRCNGNFPHAYMRWNFLARVNIQRMSGPAIDALRKHLIDELTMDGR